MSGLEFTAQLVSALAWPVMALALALALRRPLTYMLTRQPPSRVKAGPFEVEWDRIVAQTETEIQAMPAEVQTATPTGGLREELAAEAQTAPAVAVLEAYARVERELREILAEVEPESSLRLGTVGLARFAGRHELITPDTVRAIEGISVLRNLAAHGSAREITSGQAEEYLDLVDAVLFALRNPPRSA